LKQATTTEPGRVKIDRSDDASSVEPAGADWVRASDLAAWAYCRRAWWLARVQGAEHANLARLEAGIRRHGTHAESVARARRMRRAGILLIAVALLALLLILILAGGVLR
jgi:hypothetical protein